ncbi:MAG: ankyrin repeat domain-containing protein [Burkholderiales bacterium]|nr:MAG: ankyrin repeat domain-containing protein [Burkholderiales bacterium]
MHDMMFRHGMLRLLSGFFVLVFSLGALAQTRKPGPQREAPVPAAFWEAVKLDDVGRVQTQLLRGVDTNARHPELGPAIVLAARERAWGTLRLLATLAGTRVDAPNRLGETALMLAALHGHLDSVKLLAGRGAEVNRSGWTPLHYAATNGHAEVVRYLLEQHAYIDAQSPNRTTPLMMAARHKHPDVVRLLVEAGADPTPRNEAGIDAAGYLQRHGETGLAGWLRERAADYARRYGTLERPRTVEMIEEDKRRAGRPDAHRPPGARD